MSAAALRPLTACLILGVAYFAAASLTILVGRFDHGVAFVWVATAVLSSRLSVLPRVIWPRAIAACFVGSVLATGLFGFGWALALPIAVVNITEGVFGAWLLSRLNGSFDPLKSLRWVGGFLLALGLLAPALGAVAASVIVALLADQDVVVMGVRWFLGHALGTITFAPILLLAFRTSPQEWIASVNKARAPEATALLLLVVATSFGVFAQSELPLLFLPTLPVILVTFRLGRLGASASIVILAVIGTTMTLHGTGPLNLVTGSMGMHLQVLQFYLAATVMTILPVAAELAYRGELFRQLRESETRYRLVADNSSDIILNVDLKGIIRVASPSIRQMGGYSPDDVVGTPAIRLVAAEHHDAVIGAHRDVLANPDRNVIVEYQAIHANGEIRWYESHTRAVQNEANAVIGVVSAVRDIAHRKIVEGELAAAAYTDALTGLANRRAFLAEFDRRAANGGHGCVGMLDLDHFKRVNDVHGHDAGDEVLRRFALVARGCLRDGDMLARIGGEEFALLLPGAGLAQAQVVCDRIRTAVSSAPITYAGVTLLVTVSGGVAPWGAGADRQETLREADIALYRAKREGRDRLALAS
ncbi:PAS domain S-box-containing protein/diguanylate cyclase (GGDEF) domain-containing protein [Sphingomonas sp. EC-HK361]|uniref:sensor domain-containing diguanylate cyclase n=1 Tax=Sphingomonas sp. EC-HK361 TaxID=2038397 RepID=UPI0012547EB4|nr:sensor domain-containing diguanylate cyclase [Sphingomonas sp. EC-HK361]VVT11396.1 PAS domain S-box-containing protein/diguanylate cyclase (GGDEF) domain-containing protein [Sphingomonas sp. EC-HK361]